ncbi:MAG: glycoside hydrolase family protein [Pseudomonadota bacterium]
MKPRHQVSRAAIELIKTFEGYRRKAAQLPDGRWTIGYGHTLTAREGAEVDESDAEALLLYDLIAVAHAVNEHSYTPLTQNQFDALCCFAFNVGVENFRRSSVLRRVNEGQLLQAACAMEMWRKADFEGERIVIDALVRRRAAEKTLFLTPARGWVPAPSPVLKPKVDYDAVNSVPRETPTAVKASLTGERVVVERDETPAPRPVPPVMEPLASEIAAAGVSARLEQLLPEAVETLAEPEAEPQLEPVDQEPPPAPPEVDSTDEPAFEAPSEPVPAEAATAAEVLAEPEPEPEAYPQPEPTRPALAVVNGDAGFVLTPAPEVTVEYIPADALRADLPEPANESGPGLFDVTLSETVLEGGPTRPLVSEDYVRRLVQEDELAAMGGFDPAFAETPTEPARIAGLPLILAAIGGVVLFAGGVALGFTAGVDGVRYTGWALALVGIVLFTGATYLGLNRLLGGWDEAEDDNEEVPAAESEPQA